MSHGRAGDLVIVVLTTDAFGGWGGIAQYNRDLLTAICSMPERPRVVALPRLVGGPPGPLPEGLAFLDDAAGGKGRFLMRAARAVMDLPRADLVICGHVNLLAPSFLAARRFRCPLQLCAYGIDVWTPSKSRLINALVPRIDGAMAISAITRDRFAAWSGVSASSVAILPNALRRQDFAAGPKDDELTRHYGLEGRKVLLTLGRLESKERMKGFDEMIGVLPGLAKLVPEAIYVIAGDGNDRNRLEALARSTGVADRVVFTGRVKESDKARLYRCADAFVMPSRGEGFGFVFLEALACGIPAVGSKVDGGREALRDGMLGELVTPNDPADLERGILAALAKPRGVVPDGLDYFAFPRFEERTHSWIRRSLGHTGGREAVGATA